MEAKMRQSGMKVRCQTADISIPKEGITVNGYIQEDNLYSRLLSEFEMRTKKLLKR